jgi:translation elongation factor P/translation initiation factor 5A
MSQTNALDLRKGNLVSYQGRLCWVNSWNILRNDRRQFVQLTLKDIATGRMTELKEHSDSRFELVDTSQVDLSHSYTEGPEEVFYTASGEEFRCPVEAAADALRWECESYRGFLADGRLVSVATPTSIVAVVAETGPVIKGVTSGTKDAVLTNGTKIKVGQLVQTGDRVRIDADTLEFRERVTS